MHCSLPLQSFLSTLAPKLLERQFLLPQATPMLMQTTISKPWELCCTYIKRENERFAGAPRNAGGQTTLQK